MKAFTKLFTINPTKVLPTLNNVVNVADNTPAVVASAFITFSDDNSSITKSANNIAIGSMIANTPFIILVNASVILFNLACPSSVLLRDSLIAKKAETNKPIIPNDTANVLPNVSTALLAL